MTEIATCLCMLQYRLGQCNDGVCEWVFDLSPRLKAPLYSSAGLLRRCIHYHTHWTHIAEYNMYNIFVHTYING